MRSSRPATTLTMPSVSPMVRARPLACIEKTPDLTPSPNRSLASVSVISISEAAPSEIDEDEARSQIERSDRERAQFIKKHFHVDRDDATRCDLILNTSRIPPAKCPATQR